MKTERFPAPRDPRQSTMKDLMSISSNWLGGAHSAGTATTNFPVPNEPAARAVPEDRTRSTMMDLKNMGGSWFSGPKPLDEQTTRLIPVEDPEKSGRKGLLLGFSVLVVLGATILFIPDGNVGPADRTVEKFQSHVTEEKIVTAEWKMHSQTWSRGKLLLRTSRWSTARRTCLSRS